MTRPSIFHLTVLAVTAAAGPLLPMLQAGAQSQSRCSAALAFVIDEMEADYSGFPDKVTSATRTSYDRHTDSLRRRAATIQDPLDPVACHQVLIDWVDWFRDRHVAISYTPAPTAPSAQPAVAADTSAAALRARFAAAPSRHLGPRDTIPDPAIPDALSGIWETADGGYRIAILPGTAPERFDLIVLRADSVWWMPGQIKARLVRHGEARLTGEWRLRDHSSQPVTGRLIGNLLQLRYDRNPAASPVTLLRESPRRAGDLGREEWQREHTPVLGFHRVSDSTVLLRVPSFNPAFAPQIGALVTAHKHELVTTPNLIIDVRGNGGGLDHAYAPLLDLALEDTVVSPGVSMRSTPGNIAAIEQFRDSGQPDEGTRAILTDLVKRMRDSLGGFVSTGRNVVARAGTPLPRRVAILADGGCASSCEQFVLDAGQSRKVTVFGTNTTGALDYSNVTPRRVPDSPYQVLVPISRSNRLPDNPVDPEGIAPDVPILDTELRPVDFVRRWLERVGE